MNEKHRNFVLALAFGTALAVAACATPPTDPVERQEFEQTNDPLEPMNRGIFEFNLFLDKWLIKPIAETYKFILPDVVQTAIRNFLHNLNEPVVFANNIMQGEWKRAHDTFARFLFNTTIGGAGLVDVGSRNGLPAQSGDFGQTLYSWGVPDGPFLMLPVLGPTNPRDAIGMGVDSYIDPWGYMARGYNEDIANYLRWVVDGIDKRAQNIDTLDELQKNALDFYAELRSLTRQHRELELRHGMPPPTGPANGPGSNQLLYVDPEKEQAKGQ